MLRTITLPLLWMACLPGALSFQKRDAPLTSHIGEVGYYNENSRAKPPATSYGVPDKPAPVPNSSGSQQGNSIFGTPNPSFGPALAHSNAYGPPAGGYQPLQSNLGPSPSAPPSLYGPPVQVQMPSRNYGTPQRPSPSYGPPQPTSTTYGPPQQPSPSYGPPKQPVTNYGPPQQISTNYGAPLQPSTTYGVPRNPTSNKGAPQLPALNYNTLLQPFTNYGVPKQPSSNYGAPQQPSTNYGGPKESTNRDAPQQAFTSYEPPKAPSKNYGTPQQSSSNFAPQQPSNNYGAPQQPSTNFVSAPPPTNYGVPQKQQPSTVYGPPTTSATYGGNQGPSTNYAPPQQPLSNLGPPSSNYGVPELPSITYGSPGPASSPKQPSSIHGRPWQPSTNYGPPQNPAAKYGASTQQPSTSYGPPQKQAQYPGHSSYGRLPQPSQATLPPSTNYGAPQKLSTNYGAPQKLSTNYGAPQKLSTNYGAPQKLSTSYGAPQLLDSFKQASSLNDIEEMPPSAKDEFQSLNLNILSKPSAVNNENPNFFDDSSSQLQDLRNAPLSSNYFPESFSTLSDSYGNPIRQDSILRLGVSQIPSPSFNPSEQIFSPSIKDQSEPNLINRPEPTISPYQSTSEQPFSFSETTAPSSRNRGLLEQTSFDSLSNDHSSLALNSGWKDISSVSITAPSESQNQDLAPQRPNFGEPPPQHTYSSIDITSSSQFPSSGVYRAGATSSDSSVTSPTFNRVPSKRNPFEGQKHKVYPAVPSISFGLPANVYDSVTNQLQRQSNDNAYKNGS